MYFCNVDESGTPEKVGTSHFALAGFAIPCWQWKVLESRIHSIKQAFRLGEAEIYKLNGRRERLWYAAQTLEHG